MSLFDGWSEPLLDLGNSPKRDESLTLDLDRKETSKPTPVIADDETWLSEAIDSWHGGDLLSASDRAAEKRRRITRF